MIRGVGAGVGVGMGAGGQERGGIVLAVIRRRCPLLVLAAVLALAGCSDDAPEAAGSVESSAPGEAAPDEPAPSAEQPVPDRAPALPPLHPVIDDWDESVVRIRNAGGRTVMVDVKVAVTDQERQRGLMEVEELPDGAGMLFVFEDERTGGFWMRNTLVPLDIAYVGADGTIGTIMAMDPCEAEAAEDCPTYVPERPYVTALEVRQGWFADYDVAVGDTVTWSTPTT